MVIEFDICHLFSWCFKKSTIAPNLWTYSSPNSLESTWNPDQSLLNHEANTIEEKSINKDLPKWCWMFASWSSRPIVTKKIGFSRNFGQLSWALIFFSPPPTHNLWKPIAWTAHRKVWVKRVLTVVTIWYLDPSQRFLLSSAQIGRIVIHCNALYM